MSERIEPAVDRRTEMLQLATELLSEQIRPVRILSLSDEGGEPQGEFESNRQRFVFKFTRAGEVTYRPKAQGEADREDSRSPGDDLQARLERVRACLGAA
jgi:hypothetical protein